MNPSTLTNPPGLEDLLHYINRMCANKKVPLNLLKALISTERELKRWKHPKKVKKIKKKEPLRTQTFDEWVQMLQNFKRQHGHLNVHSATHPRLYAWLQRTRKRKKEDKLGLEEIELLDNLGLSWDLRTIASMTRAKKFARWTQAYRAYCATSDQKEDKMLYNQGVWYLKWLRAHPHYVTKLCDSSLHMLLDRGHGVPQRLKLLAERGPEIFANVF